MQHLDFPAFHIIIGSGSESFVPAEILLQAVALLAHIFLVFYGVYIRYITIPREHVFFNGQNHHMAI